MLKIQTLLQNVLGFVKKISKKAYKNCAIVTTGLVVVAVISLSMKSFGGSSKNNVTPMLPVLTEEQSFEEEEDMEAKVLTALSESETVSQLLSDQISSEIQAVFKQTEIQAKQNVTLLTSAIQEKEVVEDQLLQVSKDDYEALLRIVEAEATGEDIMGKMLVANVVLNRVEDSNFPNSIYDVVHDRNGGVQFSPIADGRYYSVEVSEDTKLAVERVLKGEDYSEGALFFVARSMASSKAVSWFDKNLTKVAHYGVHEFFKY
jgi:N-acetylmuramoyl-L-alanine amidase